MKIWSYNFDWTNWQTRKKQSSKTIAFKLYNSKAKNLLNIYFRRVGFICQPLHNNIAFSFPLETILLFLHHHSVSNYDSQILFSIEKHHIIRLKKISKFLDSEIEISENHQRMKIFFFIEIINLFINV